MRTRRLALHAAALLSFWGCGFLDSSSGTWPDPWWPKIERWMRTGPDTLGGRFNFVQFRDADRGIALGQGLIVRTVDGGTTWEPQRIGRQAALRSAVFLDSLRGFIAGDSGVLLKTTDGGLGWRQVSFPVRNPLKFLAFPRTGVGFAIGRGIFLSTDGGETWKPLPGLESSSGYFIHFFDGTTGVAALDDGGILRTTDGGSSWSAVRVGSPGGKMRAGDAVDASTLVLVGDSGSILHSPDSGRSWSRSVEPHRNHFTSVDFADGAMGYAMGRNPWTHTESGNLYRTRDGGLTWEIIRDTHGPADAISFPDTAIGYAVGGNGSLLKTVNGGLSWLPSAVFALSDVMSTWFPTRTTGVAVGFGIFKTQDGGGSWRRVPVAGHPTGLPYLQAVQFIDPATAIAAGSDGKMFKTWNAGDDWSEIPSGTQKRLKALHFLDGQVGFAVGEGGVFLKTADAGVHWDAAVIARQTLNSVFFTDASTGYAAGDSSTLLKTTDGGAHWTALSTDSYLTSWSAVHFLNDSVGMLAAPAGLFRTADAGKTWQRRSLGGDRPMAAILDFHFTGDSIGYAVGHLGRILKTRSAGLFWEEMRSATDARLFSVHFPDDSTGYAVGEFGATLKMIWAHP